MSTGAGRGWGPARRGQHHHLIDGTLHDEGIQSDGGASAPRRADGGVPRDGAAHPARRRRGRRGCPAEQDVRQDDDHDGLGPGSGAGRLSVRAIERRPHQPGRDPRPRRARGVPPLARAPVLGRPTGRRLRRGPPGLCRLRRGLPGVRTQRATGPRGDGGREADRHGGRWGRCFRDLPGLRHSLAERPERIPGHGRAAARRPGPDRSPQRRTRRLRRAAGAGRASSG